MGEGFRTDAVVLAVAVFGAVGIAALPTPAGLSPSGQAALATTWFAAVLWVTGAVPLWVTAVSIPVWLVGLGGTESLAAAVTGFADPVIFLFLGTFLLAAALNRQGIDRRFALRLLGLVGTTPRRVLLGTMIATAVLSMLISNTATTAMMVPIAVGLAEHFAGDRDPAIAVPNFHVALLLGTAYAATVGGLGTIIGTPPNAIVVAQLERELGVRISFVEWMGIGLPVMLVTLPLIWLVLLAIFPPAGARQSGGQAAATLAERTENLEPLGPVARRVTAVFVLTATLWLVGGLDFLFRDLLPAAVATVLWGGPDREGLLYFSVVALAAIPVLTLVGGIDREDVRRIDWGTILLFGGGLSLAAALSATGATTWLADLVLAPALGLPLFVLLGAIVLFTVAASEIASNTATVAILAPVLIDLGQAGQAELGIAGAALLLPITSAIAASYGFALPVATPPNAIVFGTGTVTRGQMLRAGVVLDLLFVPVTAVVLYVFFVMLGGPL
jgi:sodium-dependent dicarboxylate transporter 2/3/5